ncbi:hypothetical protein BHE90_000943 [Fusarium euwallaceae]|uniref:Uncharacterized protein n=1 Tax=Fusarium euwallaceae TaxID=1147111 RepID=A0A430M9L9_9HYPO|nr:hypothetical protein BHE90_000943 [Fusarium euwallaceae]
MIRKTRPSAEAAQLRSRLRVYAISDQDDTGDWIRTSFPDVLYIVSIHGFGCFDLAAWQGIGLRGAPGYEDAKIDKEWLAENIQIGPLGAAYPTMDWAMEGDTPTFLYLIQNGLDSSERPDVSSWGGRYRAITIGSSVYGDVVDKIVGNDGKSYVNQKAPVYRWRDHYQDEFAARMRWTLTPNFWGASHPPVPAINGMTGTDFIRVQAKEGDEFTFDASESYDPDHPADCSNLEFQWYQYAEPTTRYPSGGDFVPRCGIYPMSKSNAQGIAAFKDAGFENVVLGKQVRVTVPNAASMTHWVPRTGITQIEYHIVLQVSSKATFPIRRYKRIVIEAAVPPPECTGCHFCAAQGKGACEEE